MRKKDGVTLYNAGLIVLGVILLLADYKIQEEQNRKEALRKAEETRQMIETISNYTDEELIAKYHEVDMKLQEKLDERQQAKEEQTRIVSTRSPEEYSGFWGGFARAMDTGPSIKESLITFEINNLRKVKTMILTEIYKRGLGLPR